MCRQVDVLSLSRRVMAGASIELSLTLSNSLSFSISISSPMLTNSFFANCMVGMAITFVKSQLGKTYCSSFMSLFGHICAEISSRSFSMWWVSKMRPLLTCGVLHVKFGSRLLEQLTKLLQVFTGTSVTVIFANFEEKTGLITAGSTVCVRESDAPQFLKFFTSTR